MSPSSDHPPKHTHTLTLSMTHTQSLSHTHTHTHLYPLSPSLDTLLKPIREKEKKENCYSCQKKKLNEMFLSENLNFLFVSFLFPFSAFKISAWMNACCVINCDHQDLQKNKNLQKVYKFKFADKNKFETAKQPFSLMLILWRTFSHLNSKKFFYCW